MTDDEHAGRRFLARTVDVVVVIVCVVLCGKLC